MTTATLVRDDRHTCAWRPPHFLGSAVLPRIFNEEERWMLLTTHIVRLLSFERCKKNPAPHKARTGMNERRKWYLLELNQGHMDFQSIALPPELRYPLSNLRIAALSALFLICECKGSTFYSNQQTFPQKNARVSKKRCNFASVFKWGTLLGDLSID